MKRFIPLTILALAMTAAIAQEFPTETEISRKPTLITKGDVFIKNGRLLTVTKGIIEKSNILIRNGKIVAIGPNVTAPAGVPVLDASGKVVMPGIVDAHMHRGIDVTNEGSDSIVAELRMVDALNPTAKAIWTALASGETTGMILHGSANCVGAESIVAKLKYGHHADEMPFHDAPRMVKFALGENVTRSGSATSSRFPHTRMGVEAVYRRAFDEAKNYMSQWDAYAKAKKSNPKAVAPRKDLRLETLSDILKRKVWVQCHSYREDEILMMVRLSQEYGFKIGAMQHALESYKIAPELAKAGVGVSIFADSWSFKIEGYDAIPYAATILTKAGVNVSINTDGLGGTTALNIDAAKSMRFGGLNENQVIRMLTINPAKELGVDKYVGSLEVGKDGDIAIWDGHPLSVYSRCAYTIVDGEVLFQRRDALGVDKGSTTKNVLSPARYVQTTPVPPRAKTYAIVGGTIHPISGPVIPKGTVVVSDGKILAVGRSVAIPRGAVRVNATGMQVYPGFIDAGTNIGLKEIDPIGQTNDDSELGDIQPDLKAITAVQVQSEHIPVTRMTGITTVLTSPSGGTVSGQSAIINLAGWTPEQMAIVPKAGLWINFPGSQGFPQISEDQLCCGDEVLKGVVIGNVHADDDDYLGGAAQRRGPDSNGNLDPIRDLFNKAIKYQKDRAANPATPINPQLAATIPYATGKAPVMLRVRTASSIKAAVEFAKEMHLKVILMGAADAWKVTKLLADSKIPVVLEPAGKCELFANAPVSDWDPYDAPYATAALLKRAGVKFCFQSNDNAMSFDLPFRVAESCAYGLSQDDALRAITLSAAEILGIDKITGSIDKGKMGNLVITDGDPFEMTTNVRYVFINGKPVALESKFTRLRDQYAQRLTEK